MNIQFHKPTSFLSAHIESMVWFKDFEPQHAVERVVPGGQAYLIFEFDGMPRHTLHNDTLQPTGTFTKVWVSGVHTDFLSISTHNGSQMLAIQFTATGARPFMHIPMHTIAGKVVPAEDVFGAEIFALCDTIGAAQESAAKFAAAEDWLTARHDGRKAAPAPFLALLHRIHSEQRLRLADIVGTYPATHKQLIQHFKKYVGISPKEYHRIIRFNEILKAIHQTETVSWSQLAYTLDYSDQSHFIKEFRHFSGFNPVEFLQLGHQHNEELNFFPLTAQG
ncbi:MAG: AraC family transcriptional regulator [Bacteroidota bacterium]